MEDLMTYLQQAVAAKASDLFLVAGSTLRLKCDGTIRSITDAPLKAKDTETLIQSIYQLSQRPMSRVLQAGDDDFSFSVSGLSRFRVNTYRQRGSLAAVIRLVSFAIPEPQALHIPDQVIQAVDISRGMVLVTGAAGSGKSTTLACMIDHINSLRNANIITLEDPIEYLHRNKQSVISQREIGVDTCDSLTGLRACLRQSPDVIFLGEMRDYDTIRTAMTAAETGHLLVSSLHTMGAVNTIDRIIDVFPPNQQYQVRVQLALTLTTVISQQLLPDTEGGLIPAFEIMHATNAIRNMIRESKTYQIDNVLQTSRAEGMVSMDNAILELYRAGRITVDTALRFSMNSDQMQRKINN